MASKLREAAGISDSDIRAAQYEQEFCYTRQVVLDEVQLQHPNAYDNFNLCDMHKKRSLKTLSIDKMHKWRPTKYSFVFVLIRPTSLVLKEHFFCILSVATKLVSLISTKTKEYFFGHHICIRSIAMLKIVCKYFGLCTDGFHTWRKAEYISALEELIEACSCCSV